MPEAADELVAACSWRYLLAAGLVVLVVGVVWTIYGLSRLGKEVIVPWVNRIKRALRGDEQAYEEVKELKGFAALAPVGHVAELMYYTEVAL